VELMYYLKPQIERPRLTWQLGVSV
jgi:hypothetical protein